MKTNSNANPASAQQLFNCGNLSVNAQSFSINRNTNSQIAVSVGFSTTEVNSTRVINNTMWNHIGVVVLPPNNNTSGGFGTTRNILIYLNGENVTDTATWSSTGTIQTAKSTSPTNDWITLGKSSNASSNYFAGFMDDIRVYDVALTPKEIRGIYLNSTNYSVINNDT
jgi:hypothetical protein